MTTGFDKGRAASQVGSAESFSPATPNDAADLPQGLTRALFVGGEGTVTVRGRHGDEATFSSQAGQYHPLRVARVMATGTTATGIVALY